MTRHPRGRMGFFSEHSSILFLPSGEGCFPHLRVCWCFYQQEQGCNPSERLGCLKRTMQREQSFRLSIDVGQTPLMRHGSEMRGNSLDNGTFPVAHGSGRKVSAQETCEYVPIAGKCFVALAWHKRPEKIFLRCDIPVHKKDSQTTQPFAITSIHPRRWMGCSFRQQNLPGGRRAHRVIQKSSKADGQRRTRPVVR